MSGLLREVGKAFGHGSAKVDRGLQQAEQRRKMREAERAQDLESEEQAARIRSVNGGRRAALASQVRDTMG